MNTIPNFYRSEKLNHVMTVLLKRAISEVERLPEEQQNVLASIILEEMVDERKWDDAFARSQDKLATLADEALQQLRSGETTPLKF
jgi:hypothetical protein